MYIIKRKFAKIFRENKTCFCYRYFFDGVFDGALGIENYKVNNNSTLLADSMPAFAPVLSKPRPNKWSGF